MEQTSHGAFWDDLAENLEDPEFRRAYVVESMRIATVDRIMNELDAARAAAGLSKAALARAIGTNPDAVRRLLTAGNVNPTLGTLVEVAAVLGMRVTLEPLPADEQANISRPLLQDEHPDTAGLAQYLTELREGQHDELLYT